MLNFINGCNITLTFWANELTSNDYAYTLPKGYSINIMHVTNAINVDIVNKATVRNDTRLIFPVVDSKSPSTITVHIPDLTKNAELRFTIEKFGQIPDDTYFNYEFYPISVTGDDGKKYNVIQSDQFK